MTTIPKEAIEAVAAKLRSPSTFPGETATKVAIELIDAYHAALGAGTVAQEPVAWIAKSRWERMTNAEPWLTNIVYSENQEPSFSCVALYAASPSFGDGIRAAASLFMTAPDEPVDEMTKLIREASRQNILALLATAVQNQQTMTDHARGCEGRNYTCTCGYDEQRAVAVPEVAVLTQLGNAVLAQAPIEATEFMGVPLSGIRSTLSSPPSEPAPQVVDYNRLEAEIMNAIDDYRESMPGDKFGPHAWPTVNGIKDAVRQGIRAALASQEGK